MHADSSSFLCPVRLIFIFISIQNCTYQCPPPKPPTHLLLCQVSGECHSSTGKGQLGMCSFSKGKLINIYQLFESSVFFCPLLSFLRALFFSLFFKKFSKICIFKFPFDFFVFSFKLFIREIPKDFLPSLNQSNSNSPRGPNESGCRAASRGHPLPRPEEVGQRRHHRHRPPRPRPRRAGPLPAVPAAPLRQAPPGVSATLGVARRALSGA